jgi:hypothetical protein
MWQKVKFDESLAGEGTKPMPPTVTTAPNLNLVDYVGVISTFINAYTAFNNQDLAALGNLIDNDAVLYTLNTGTAIRGQPAIMQFFQTKFASEKPICALVSIELHPPGLPTTVRGEAHWSYAGWTNPTTFSVHYEFRFQPHYPYLITWMWATPS